MSQSKEEQLYNAAFRGELEEVKSLCHDPALNINWQYEGRFTPFYVACQERHVGVMKHLLSLQGIDPNMPQNDGASPFYTACQEGHEEVVSLLLADPRTDLEEPNNNGATPFYMTCQEGHKEVVSLLLADPRIDSNKLMNDGATPFFMACQNGHEEVVSLLLLLAEPRIDPNKPLKNYISPLWIASQNGHLLVVKQLFASGIDIDTTIRSTFNNRTAAEHGKAMGIRNKDQDIAPVGTSETEEEYLTRKTNGPLCADLIDAYEKDPASVRSR